MTDAALLKSTPPLTEDALRARYVGKLIFLRGSYLGDDLNFDQDGKVNGSPTAASFTLSAFEVRKVKLSKRKLEIEADRYGLHSSARCLSKTKPSPSTRSRSQRNRCTSP